MSKENEIAKRFATDHITPTEDLLKEVKEATGIEPEKVKPTENLKSQKEYTFDFDWTSPVGKRYQGKFTNKILNIAEQQSVGLTRARLGGGMPVDAIDVLTREINLMVAHMSFSLIKTPNWAADLRELVEIPLLQELYTEVASHEATFFGYGKTETKS